MGGWEYIHINRDGLLGTGEGREVGGTDTSRLRETRLFNREGVGW